MTDPFAQARLKCKWANKHLNELHTDWVAYLEDDFCEITVEDDIHGDGQFLRVNSFKPLSVTVPLLVGDVVHNLKAALDHAINAILEDGRDTRLTFPMAETREELVTSFRTEGLDPCPSCGSGGKGKGRNSAVELAAPGIGAFIIDQIRPYRDAGGYLWPLNRLDNRDKHRLLILTIGVHTISGVNAVDQNDNRVVNGTVSVTAGRSSTPFGLCGGTKIESYAKPTAEIFLNETGAIEMQRLFPTLVQMRDAVEETLNLLGDFVRATKTVS